MAMGRIAEELEMQADALKPFNNAECTALIVKLTEEFLMIKPEYEKALLPSL